MSRDFELGQNLSGDFWKKFSSDLNEIWYVGRGRWLMHDGMPCGRIQGQSQGHEPLKVWIPSIFKTYLHSREVDRQSPTGLILYC